MALYLVFALHFFNYFVLRIESLLRVQFCVDRELQNKDKVLIRSTEAILKKPGTARLGDIYMKSCDFFYFYEMRRSGMQ
jgi:hypothetical protein